MATTYSLISSVTLSSSAASITFSSIPATFTDLCLVLSLRQDQTASNDGLAPSIKFNNSSSNFTNRTIRGTGSAASSISTSTNILLYASNPSDYTANTFANAQIYIPNYTSSNNKSFSLDGVSENNATASLAAFTANLWSDVSAITSIILSPFNSANFVQYSTAYLYGISNA
jgi:hypothetical protein